MAGSCQTRLVGRVSIRLLGCRGLWGAAVLFSWVCCSPLLSLWASLFAATDGGARSPAAPACALPCPASAAPAPKLQGTPRFCFTPSVPFPLLLSTPFPTFTFSKMEGKKKTVKRGMLTDKPTQLSEASMSVLWMILFTS